MVDLDRLTKREAYEAGLAAGEAKVAGPQWTKPTFALAVMVTLFAMWASGYTLMHVSEPTVELVITLIGTVSAIPIAYAWGKNPADKNGGGSR